MDSSDEESIIDSTSVQLGFVDCNIDPNEELPTIEDTILGGSPIWLHPNSLPNENLVTCNICGKKMALLLQAFAPFNNQLYDRVIYVFGCQNTNNCSFQNGSIKCIRGICKDPVKMEMLKKEQEAELQKDLDEKLNLENKKKLTDELTRDLFGSGETKNPFAASSPFSGSNPFGSITNKESQSKKSKDKDSKDSKESKEKEPQTYASIVKQNLSEKIKKQPNTYTLPEYPGFFTFVGKEKFKKQVDPDLEKYKDLIDSNSIEEDDKSNITMRNVHELNPQAAKISSQLQDKFFEHFSEIVQYNPHQILRYDLGGTPLLYNGKDKVAKAFGPKPFNIPKPSVNPSSSRQFEMQLMPKAIIELESEDVNILSGMSWGTIIVCTDVEDYIPEEEFDENYVGYIEEYCGVQWEEQ